MYLHRLMSSRYPYSVHTCFFYFSAFVRYPNGVIVHYYCCRDTKECPVDIWKEYNHHTDFCWHSKLFSCLILILKQFYTVICYWYMYMYMQWKLQNWLSIFLLCFSCHYFSAIRCKHVLCINIFKSIIIIANCISFLSEIICICDVLNALFDVLLWNACLLNITLTTYIQILSVLSSFQLTWDKFFKAHWAYHIAIGWCA